MSAKNALQRAINVATVAIPALHFNVEFITRKKNVLFNHTMSILAQAKKILRIACKVLNQKLPYNGKGYRNEQARKKNSP